MKYQIDFSKKAEKVIRKRKGLILLYLRSCMIFFLSWRNILKLVRGIQSHLSVEILLPILVI